MNTNKYVAHTAHKHTMIGVKNVLSTNGKAQYSMSHSYKQQVKDEGSEILTKINNTE